MFQEYVFRFLTVRPGTLVSKTVRAPQKVLVYEPERRTELRAALERLLDESNKPGPGGNGPLLLTPLEQLERPAALVPPRIRLGRHGEVLPRMAAHRIGTFANGRSWPH